MVAVLMAIGCLLLSNLGCSKQCANPDEDGDCPEVCQDSRCPDGERCVENRCSATCNDDDECSSRETCESVTADYGGRGDYCVLLEGSDPDEPSPNADAGPSPPIGTGDECKRNSDCDAEVEQRCVQGHCLVACTLHEHCAGVGACAGDAVDVEGQPLAYCTADDFPRGPGQFDWRCIDGNDDCDTTSGFRCFGSGEGDLDGYCTQLGCGDDDACPVGYYCDHNVFASAVPCQDACGLSGVPTDPQCIDVGDIGEDRPYRCAEGGLELRSCQRRRFCNTCESDADCRTVANQVCAADGSGDRICTTPCSVNSNSCPWGSASACQMTDTDLGYPTCRHRAGSCRGAGATCDPCVDDRDCPTGACNGNPYTLERYCIDYSQACTCPSDDPCLGGGCPLSPGGLQTLCFPTAGVCAGSPVNPADDGSQLGCWPLAR